jgi:cytochrome c-type biogenesis protein CcmF
MFAVAAMLGWQSEDIRAVRAGETFAHGGYDLTLIEVRRLEGPNYLSTMATIEARREGRLVATLYPEKRIYPAAGMPTTEAAIHYRWDRDLYLTLGDPQQDGSWAVRTYIRPFANWLWAGCILMALGGLISLSDRRYRMAAGARRAPPPQATPAE